MSVEVEIDEITAGRINSEGGVIDAFHDDQGTAQLRIVYFGDHMFGQFAVMSPQGPQYIEKWVPQKGNTCECTIPITHEHDLFRGLAATLHTVKVERV